MVKFLQSYFTDIGIKRKTNQDSVGLFKADTDKGEVLFAIICDGMGGHQFGELASKTIVDEFEKWFKTEFPYLLYKDFSSEQLRSIWSQIVYKCNADLVVYGHENGIEMGSTLTAGLFIENKYYIIHVGDSRAYEISEEGIKQITDDQSFVAEAIRNGEMTLEEAQRDKRKNQLLECVGITTDINILFYAGMTKEQATYVLCTDGFWHTIESDEFVRYLAGKQFDSNKMLRMHLNYLVETVKQRNERDNISVVGLIPYEGEKL